ncbi:MAG: sensor histidine kinase [Spirulina sp. SIO3F2]|nr:sensor histidine kinase [Spirulina sp. SIO3F2]
MDADQEILALKQQVAQLQLAYQQSLQLSHFKGTFLARTSHELRGPLSSLMGLHQLILSDLCESQEEERDFVRQAHEASKRLLALLDKIVYVSKLEQGSSQLNLQPLNLQRLLSEVETLTHLQAQNRGYPLEIVVPDADATIQGDEKRLVQILVSLLDSAIDSMKSGSLHLSCHTEASKVTLTLKIQSSELIWSSTKQLYHPAPEEYELTPHSLSPDTNTDATSPALTWMVADGILKHMGGQLYLSTIPTSETAPDTTFTTVHIVLPQGLDPE